ncbi:MAG TPA: T9SS type A sorting domain-containing protein, partial [Ignavibacteria bacterium]|nr:T9SS type A sorting domain-containing protein [Ignavibacteria bacterium]
SKGAVWSFQSDWKFLLGVAMFDTGSVVSNTNGKNLIKWMVEDKGIFCDPHSHEANGYNYADIAYLHQQLGITPTKVVGGFLYDTVVNGNNWENLESGIYGRMYPFYFWQPDILWGGGTPLHVNDPYPLGAWKPKSMNEYYVHDSTRHLLLLAHGCENHIEDTSNIYYNVETLRNLVRQIDNGRLPDSGFYPAFSIFNVGDLNSSRVLKISQFIDSVNALTAGGRVQWKSLTQIYNIWNSTYGKKPYYVMCEDIPLAVEQVSSSVPRKYFLSQNYPNPFNPITKLKFQISRSSFTRLVIFDVTGKEITALVNEEMDAGTYEVSWDGSNYPSGVYFCELTTEGFTQTRKMALIK